MTIPPDLTGLDAPASQRNLAENGAVNAIASMYEVYAVIAALMQRELIDPEIVAKWAEALATMQSVQTDPAIRAGVTDQLAHFARILRNFAQPLDGGTMTKQ